MREAHTRATMDGVASGLRFAAIALTALAIAASPAAADPAAAVSTSPRSAPAATQGRSQAPGATRARGDDTAFVPPASESDDATRLVLFALVGIIVLFVVPTQCAKTIARRRAQATLAPTPFRRGRKRT